MEDNRNKDKPAKQPPKPHPVGITALDTKFCFLSLLYPFRLDRDIHRHIFVFKDDKRGGVFLDKDHYSELSGKYKSQIKDCEQKQIFSFILLLVALAAAFIFSFKIFTVLAVIALLVTGYEYLDRRILYLWLRREYYRKRPNAETESFGGRETD